MLMKTPWVVSGAKVDRPILNNLMADLRPDDVLLDNQVFSNLLIFILHLIAKINDLRGVDVKTVRIHQKT